MMEGKNSVSILKSKIENGFLFSLLNVFQHKLNLNLMVELFNTVFVRFLILIINFLATVLITRALSVEDRGNYAILLNLINTLVTIFTFGFHTSIVYRISNNSSLFSSLYIISAIISIFSIFIILIFFSFSQLLSYFSELDLYDCLLLGIGCPIVLMSYFSSFFFLGVNKFQQYNFFEFIKSFAFLLFVCLFFELNGGYKTYIALFVFSSIIHIIGSSFYFITNDYFQSRFVDIKINFKNYFSTFKKSFSYSMISYISCILALFLSRYTLFFIDGVEGIDKTTIGYYSVALHNIDIISILPSTLAFFIFPKISAMADMKTKLRITINMIIVILLFFIFIGAISFSILGGIFDILYGPLYQEAVPMFQLLLPSALFLSIISCISSFIGGIGNHKVTIYAPLSGFIVMSLSSLYLFYTNVDIYNFINVQNIAYLIYIFIYLNFFIKKWRESDA